MADALALQRDLDNLAIWEQKWKMSFYIDKCHIMKVHSPGRKVENQISFNYTLHDQPLQTVDQATYLGVDIKSDLSWDGHVNKVTTKASQTLGFLQRNLHSASKETKAAAYKSLVRPVLEYSLSAWDPHLQKDKDKLESVQKRAARFVTNNYAKQPGTMTHTLSTLNWPSLESRRYSSKLVLFYNIVYVKVEIDISQYLQPNLRPSRYHHNLAYHTIRASHDVYKHYIDGT